jgi:hypothetical protein
MVVVFTIRGVGFEIYKMFFEDWRDWVATFWGEDEGEGDADSGVIGDERHHGGWRRGRDCQHIDYHNEHSDKEKGHTTIPSSGSTIIVYRCRLLGLFRPPPLKSQDS